MRNSVNLTEFIFQITEFFSGQLESLGPGRAAYESAVQSIKGNIGWLEKHKSAVQESVKTD